MFKEYCNLQIVEITDVVCVYNIGVSWLSVDLRCAGVSINTSEGSFLQNVGVIARKRSHALFIFMTK